jgi:hypothetical protein
MNTYRFFTRLLLCLLAGWLWLAPQLTQAQTNWRELKTNHFAILFVPGGDDTAQLYAGFVDSIYDEIAGIFGHATETPLTLRLYPNREQYRQDNPLAPDLPGIVAHADFRRRELVVILSQTVNQTPEEVQNNIRHELTHIVAADLSEARLNVNFQEGFAQFVERPSRELEIKIRLLRQYTEADQLLSWSDLDNRETFYGNPDIAYPQSLSIVAFLNETYSFAKLRDFLTISARSSGYRSALERAFGVSPNDLEQQWRAWLPRYIEGGYRQNIASGYDLARAEQMLRDGRYTEAAQELALAIEGLRNNDPQQQLANAEQLLQRVEQGRQAEQLANQARALLEQQAYNEAYDTAVQAQAAYQAIGDTRQDAVLAEYLARAERGQRASETLGQAQTLVDSFQYPQARQLLDQAMLEFSALGDGSGLGSAQTLRSTVDQRQSWFGAALLALGAGGVVISVLRRLMIRETEAW